MHRSLWVAQFVLGIYFVAIGGGALRAPAGAPADDGVDV